MAEAIANSPPLTSVARLTRNSDMVFAVAMVGIMALLVLPMPAGIISVFLAGNLSLAVLILLVSIYAREPLEFSTFPSLLLVTTLARLGLNVATTRLILLTGTGGAVIETFGQFVVGGNFVVGAVVFVILVIIQLVVVTKGAGRVSEVAARFTLDAMPGKQMAIDADLNAGLISEKEARERREKIASEAEFYGAMDGASKFVKGDAIAGLIITIVNIAAGIIIGMTMMNMTAGQAVQTFAILTIGDGLVSQIPSLMIAIGSGMLVTKARSEESIGTELPAQFLVKEKALLIGGCMVLALALVPGMPLIPFAITGTIMLAFYYTVRHHEAETAAVSAHEAEQEAEQPEQQVEDLLASDRIGVEIGYRLIGLVDKERGGTLLERITALRKQFARDNGLLVPPIRIKDNIQLSPSVYRISIYGEEVAHGELMSDRLLAIDGGGITTPIQGLQTKEPAFGLDAVWIEDGRREEAEALGYAVTDPSSVFITHLTQVLKHHAARLLNREDVQAMLDSLKRDCPVLVKEITDNVKLGTVQKVVALLLEEGVPITNFEKILETISDHPDREATQLVEMVRSNLGRSVTAHLLDDQGRLPAVILHPATEQRLASSIVAAQQGGGLGIAPAEASALIDRLGQAVQDALAQNCEPVLLTTGQLRRHMRQITQRMLPDLAVVSYGEIGADIPVEVLTTIGLEDA